MFLDWLQYTIKEVFTNDDDVRLIISRVCASLPTPLKDLIGYSSFEFDRVGYRIQKGVNHYGSSLVFDNDIKITYAPCRDSMGTNIIIPGSALKLKPLTQDDIEEWLTDILPRFDYKITRCDIACDTDVDFSYFYQKYNSGEFITRYLNTSLKTYLNLDNRGTLYFGTRGKGTFIRIYDKYLERLEKLNSARLKAEFRQEMGGKPWTRLEMECRDGQAEQMLFTYIEGRCGDVFLGHLNFVECMKSNKSRCVTDEIYLSVINADGKRRLVKTVNQDINIDWVINVAATNLFAIREVHPKLFSLILERVIASPQAVSKAKMSKLELDRLYFSILKMSNEENNGLIDPVIIEKTLKLKECM